MDTIYWHMNATQGGATLHNFGAMTFDLKFALYLPHLKSLELIHFKRTAVENCKQKRQQKQIKYPSSTITEFWYRLYFFLKKI